MINKKKKIRSKVDTNRYFVCNNYEVISNLFRCDGTANCRDGSDETEGCSISDECLESQFQCANSHCIAIGKVSIVLLQLFFRFKSIFFNLPSIVILWTIVVMDPMKYSAFDVIVKKIPNSNVTMINVYRIIKDVI